MIIWQLRFFWCSKKYNYKYLSYILNIALGLSTDGIAPFKKWTSTAWSLIIFNYNLPPEIHFCIENIVSLGVIPGPKEPVNVNSILIPLIMKLDHLAEGVCIFSAILSKFFALCMHLIIVFGDIPKVSMLMQMKGHNSLSPCCMCEITGLHIPNSHLTTHYFPHHYLNNPNLPWPPPNSSTLPIFPCIITKSYSWSPICNYDCWCKSTTQKVQDKGCSSLIPCEVAHFPNVISIWLASCMGKSGQNLYFALDQGIQRPWFR